MNIIILFIQVPLYIIFNFFINHTRRYVNVVKHPHPFLALLDYVSRAHEIEIRPSSVRPSVCGIDYL